MLNRIIQPKLKKSLTQAPAVALLGPRQIGKTTLAQAVGEQQDALYLDLESPEDIVKLTDPVAFLRQHNDKLVILDEIQRAPDLFMALRGLIDENRKAGKKSGQFLLLGSASMDLLRQSAESLAGRITYLSMSGLNALEVPHATPQDMQKLWLRGGFPDSYLAGTDSQSMEWLEMLIRTYLERDVPQMGFRVPAARLRCLWTMLAHLQGEPLNYSKLAANLDVDGKTIVNYIDILVDLLLVRRLDPWHTNIKKRLIKSPRYYVRDNGILHRLLGIHSHDELLSNPILGKSWEGLVIENILSLLPNSVESYYYRTSSGAEIDLVLKFSSTNIWAIEIKHGTAPKVKSTFHSAAEDIGATQKYVVYSGQDSFPIGHNAEMISLPLILEKLHQKVSSFDL